MTVNDWHSHAEQVLTQQSPLAVSAMPLLVAPPEPTPSYDVHASATSTLAADLAALTRVLLGRPGPAVAPEDEAVSATALAYASQVQTEFVPLFQPQPAPQVVAPVEPEPVPVEPAATVPAAAQHQPLATRKPVAPSSDPRRATSMLSELAFLDI